jgi:hypothetical protein
MEAPGPAPLVLPPALTYLIARAFDRAHARRGTGAAAARLDGLLRDAARYLVASGATPAEVEAAIRDVCAGAGALQADAELRLLLGELEARAHAFAAAAGQRACGPSRTG